MGDIQTVMQFATALNTLRNSPDKIAKMLGNIETTPRQFLGKVVVGSTGAYLAIKFYPGAKKIMKDAWKSAWGLKHPLGIHQYGLLTFLAAGIIIPYSTIAFFWYVDRIARKQGRK